MKKLTINEQVVDRSTFEGGRLLTLRTSLKGVVFFSGSILGGSIFAPESLPCVAYTTSRMLSQSTKRRSKEKISAELASLGATLSFSRSTFRVHFAGRCRRKDLDKVIGIAAEALREPKFSQKEFEIVKKRMQSEFEEAKDDTDEAAHTNLMRQVFPAGHPNHDLTPEEAIEVVKKITLDDVKKFHAAHYGLGSLIVSIGGDVKREVAEAVLRKRFGSWKKVTLTKPKTKPAGIGRRIVLSQNFRDKASIDYYMGGALHIDRNHKDFYPLIIAFAILGAAGFSSRLYQEVREKQGLTYHTYATLTGLEPSVDGYWYAYGTFAPQLFEKGSKAIFGSVKSWHKGISAEELELKKEFLSGNHLVRLSTTRALTGAIQQTAEQGRPISYLDDFPKIIHSISRAQVNAAIRHRIDLKRVVTSAAGTFNK